VCAFRPCGSRESWWVEGKEEVAKYLTTEYEYLAPSPYEEVYVRLRGKPSEKGQFGHLNAYGRTFSVEDVIAIRPRLPSDCK